MSINADGYSAINSSSVMHEDTHLAKSKQDITPIEYMVDPNERLGMAHDPYDQRCEKIRALRTELLLRREPNRADVIALLSPDRGEGRSLLAAELAIAFAQMGRPTLLVDADLRHPRQHMLFGTDNGSGLVQAIQSGTRPQYRRVRGLPRMWLLTAGDVPTNPLELLTSNDFASMIDEWRENYEFVVIDTAPVSHFSDGLVVANLAGRVLAMSRAQHTTYKAMQDMLRRLGSTQSQVLGAVISYF